MRLFVGILLPKDIATKIFNIQKDISSTYAKIAPIHKKNLHITLKFLGEIKGGDLKRLMDRLSKINFEPFLLKLNNLKFFKKNRKIIYFEVSPKENLVSLQQKVDQELLDIFKFDQTFLPHISIGRLKLIKDEQMFKDKLKKNSEIKESFTVSKFSLIESKLTKDGPKYKILKDFNK